MRHFSHPSQRRARLALWLAALAALSVLQGGVATADPAPQIVGGRDADPGEYPFAVALLARGLSGTARDRQFCTGSLVAPRWVLTAAHCTFTGGGQALLVQDVEVVVNRTDINDTNQGQLRTIKRIARHPFYNHLEYLGGSQWDAALLELNEPVPNVEPIELASVDDDPLERNDRELTAIGWGYTDPEGTKTPTKLQEVELPAVDDATCKERFKNAGIWEADDMTFAVTLCAGGIVGKDTCSGDSGGPLLGRDEDGDWVQTGITSARFGELCAQSLPSIFTEVNSSLIEDDEPSIWDWVTETAGIHGKAVFSPISGGPDMLVGVQVFNREGVEVKVNVVSGGPATGPNPGTETFYGSRTLPPRSSGEPLIFTPPEERGPIRIETVDASARVDATVNYIRRTDGDKIATVEAITAGEHVQYLPLLARDNDGRGNALPGDPRPGADHNVSDGVSSFFWLQNTSMRATSAQVEYFKDGELLGDDTYVIPARIGVLVRQRDLKVDLDTTRSGAITREEEVFSAKVTSDERVATAVMQEDASQLLGYRAFGQDAPATMLSAPLVMANNGASTGVQVQNTGTRDTEVTITYSANIANPAATGDCAGSTPRPRSRRSPSSRAGSPRSSRPAARPARASTTASRGAATSGRPPSPPATARASSASSIRWAGARTAPTSCWTRPSSGTRPPSTWPTSTTGRAAATPSRGSTSRTWASTPHPSGSSSARTPPRKGTPASQHHAGRRTCRSSPRRSRPQASTTRSSARIPLTSPVPSGS